jgi:hypothetical protein
MSTRSRPERPKRPPLTTQLRMLEIGLAQGRAAAEEIPAPAPDPAAGGAPDGAAGGQTATPVRARRASSASPPTTETPTTETPTTETPGLEAAAEPATPPVPTQGGAGAPQSADAGAGRALPTVASAPQDAAAGASLPAAGDRALAGPPSVTDEMVGKALNLAPAVVQAAQVWLRQRRQTVRKPAISWLLDAALVDLPTDPAQLYALAGQLPAAVLADRPQQVTVRIRRTTAARVEDAAFELAQTRRRDVPLWHAISAAVVRQLHAEGTPVDLPS